MLSEERITESENFIIKSARDSKSGSDIKSRSPSTPSNSIFSVISFDKLPSKDFE